MEIVILVVYGLALSFIFCYSIIQLSLACNYIKCVGKEQISNSNILSNPDSEKYYPFVTVQLPLYNEKYVVERLIDAVMKLDYPSDKLEIQLLDDSNDETVLMVSNKIKEYETFQKKLIHIQRKERSGFKAGALAEGLKRAKGEFIAIFDADFVPSTDFLLQTIPYFKNSEVGMVQTRWDHLNANYSLLTKLQAFGLNAHFSVEQTGRNTAGHFINFNGTAGIWRKTTIIDSGGWQSDTLTEDLDLSYRAQLKGWKFKFLENVGSPAELPVAMNALKTQQFRWTKGAAECTRKNLLKVLRAPEFRMSTKMHAVFHLMNSSIFICIVITSLLSFPVLWIKQHFPEYQLLYQLAGIFLLGVVFLSIFYFVSFSRNYPNKWKAIIPFLIKFPLFLSVSMGLSLHNGLAAFEGLIGRKSPFIRTPKFNLKDKKDKWSANQYAIGKLNKLSALEFLLTIYFAFAVTSSFYYDDYGLLPFHLMLLFGFGYVSFNSIWQSISMAGK